MTSSKTLFYFCLVFIAGIFIGSIIFISQLILLGFFVFGIILISVFWGNSKIVIFGFCVTFLVFGIWRVEIAQLNIKNNDFEKYGLFGKDIVLTGTILREPDIREKIIKLTVGNIKINDNSIKGKIIINAPRYPEYKYGDSIKTTGMLEEPGIFEGFNYKDFLLKDGIFATVSFPKIELLENQTKLSATQRIYKGILFLKDKIRKSIYQNYSPPQSLILEGTILGDYGVMDANLKNKLNITGLRHVVAISGSHVIILSSILMSFLLMLGFWRGQAFYISVVFVIVYILMTGFPASGVRAGIMGIIFLVSQKSGRQNTSSRIIFLAGALMLLINPLILTGDVGFQLSFLSAMGIIYLYPLLKSKLKFLPREKFLGIKEIVSTTISAQIFTLPVLVFNFGNISLVSLITNILVLPVVYWLMVFGFISALLGVFSGFLGWIFSLPCWILLFYFTKIMDFFSFPWAIKNIGKVHWFWLFVFYLIIGYLTFYFNKKEKLKFLDY